MRFFLGFLSGTAIAYVSAWLEFGPITWELIACKHIAHSQLCLKRETTDKRMGLVVGYLSLITAM